MVWMQPVHFSFLSMVWMQPVHFSFVDGLDATIPC